MADRVIAPQVADAESGICPYSFPRRLHEEVLLTNSRIIAVSEAINRVPKVS